MAQRFLEAAPPAGCSLLKLLSCSAGFSWSTLQSGSLTATPRARNGDLDSTYRRGVGWWWWWWGGCAGGITLSSSHQRHSAKEAEIKLMKSIRASLARRGVSPLQSLKRGAPPATPHTPPPARLVCRSLRAHGNHLSHYWINYVVFKGPSRSFIWKLMVEIIISSLGKSGTRKQQEGEVGGTCGRQTCGRVCLMSALKRLNG